MKVTNLKQKRFVVVVWLSSLITHHFHFSPFSSIFNHILDFDPASLSPSSLAMLRTIKIQKLQASTRSIERLVGQNIGRCVPGGVSSSSLLCSLSPSSTASSSCVQVHRQRQELMFSSTASNGGQRCASTTSVGDAAAATAAKIIKENKSSSYSNKGISFSSAFTLTCASLFAGYLAGSSSHQNEKDNHHHNRELPNGHPRGCCSCDSPKTEESPSSPSSPSSIYDHLTEEQKHLPNKLQQIVGTANVISGIHEDSSNTMYLKGARLGRGRALAIVTPTTLSEALKVLRAVVDSNCVVVPQGSNTGLTGGSVPREDCDPCPRPRPPVIISMKKLDTMFPIDDGTKVVCLAGSGIATLAQSLPAWGFPDRESHSTLGSTFLNPTTAAGVAFGSGGTQLRKGPAYTDRALYVKVVENKWGRKVLEVVNTLGIEGIEDDDFVNEKDVGSAVVEQLDTYATDVRNGYRRPMANSSVSSNGRAMASDRTYKEKVCKTEEPSISRFNADTRGADCNRSEGKVLILATVHDTFPKPAEKKTFWISCTDLETALEFRKEVCLDNADDLPMSVEYMDRDSFDVIDRSGRVMGNIIKVVGMGSIIGMMWKVKLQIEALPLDGAELFCDKFLHLMNKFTPALLPSRMMEMGKKYDHHIAITVGDFGNNEMERIMQRIQQFKKSKGEKIEIQECMNDSEEMSITAFRFVAAPAFRTYCVGENIQGFSVDYALPNNGGHVPLLFEEGGEGGDHPVPIKRMRYSHFGCNVVHEDLAYDLGVDTHAAKYAFKKQIELGCGGKVS